MRLPFGLDLISLLVGMAMVWFIIPWVMGFINRPKATAPAQS
jgi:hypothetical protein